MKKIIYIVCIVLGVSFQSVYAQGESEELSLSDAISITLKNNYDLTITKNDEKITQINNTWGNTSIIPSIDLGITGQDSKNFNDDEDYNSLSLKPQITLDWTLFDGFSARINKANYVELQKRSEGNTALLVEYTIQDIILAYNNSLVQKSLMNVYKSMSDLSEDRMDRVKNKKDIGATTTYDYLLYKTSYLEDYSNYIKQKVTYENSIRTLNYLMASEDNKIWNLITPLKADTTSYNITSLLEKLKSNNQNLKNQYINQSILALQSKSAENSYYPSLKLNAGVNNYNQEMYYSGNTANSNTKYNQMYAGLTLSWNIFNGGTRKRAVQIAKINEESGDVETKQMIHSLSNKLYQLYSSYNTYKAIYTLNVERLKAAALNLSISKQKYDVGAISSLDYRQIQQTYLSAQVDKLQAAYNLIESKTNLLQITGSIVSNN